MSRRTIISNFFHLKKNDNIPHQFGRNNQGLIDETIGQKGRRFGRGGSGDVGAVDGIPRADGRQSFRRQFQNAQIKEGPIALRVEFDEARQTFHFHLVD